MPGHDLIVIGASAGGVRAVTEVLRGLPADLPAAVAVVLHTAADSPSILPRIFGRAGPLEVIVVANDEPLRHGRVFLPPPDHHLLIKGQRMILTRGPKENGFRPAVDPLFRTAATEYGARVIGVVLSGNLDDGTEGLAVIKKHGGIAIAQDPGEADFPGMPTSAVANVKVDHVLTVREISAELVRLAHEPLPKGAHHAPSE